ncbi:MAG: sulfide/dihydroorotate dehydrogenase-like FAD/NAD-binding protein [Chloroflexi bacterium]|nr:sulfide/dihydroorotate dehydrogenase-like FAD/NAD-binding protein [Chloroflexota bacterium]
MYKITYSEKLAPAVHLFRIEAPRVAQKAQAGQFVILRIDERGERIPLTVADYDREEGTVTVVFLEVGKTTRHLATLAAGDEIVTFAGPLGLPSHIDNFGTVVCMGGGVGVAALYPIARALKEANNRVISIMGARTKDLLFWEEEMRSVSDELIVTTDDGSHGRKGVVTEPLKERLDSGDPINRVIAVGPAIMMKFCALTSKPYGIETVVSLNPIMIDGTGLCGGCRVSVGGATRFACVDGPDFDGHQVDWDLLLARQRTYQTEEKQSQELWQTHLCDLQEAGKR